MHFKGRERGGPFKEKKGKQLNEPSEPSFSEQTNQIFYSQLSYLAPAQDFLSVQGSTRDSRHCSGMP